MRKYTQLHVVCKDMCRKNVDLTKRAFSVDANNVKLGSVFRNNYRILAIMLTNESAFHSNHITAIQTNHITTSLHAKHTPLTQSHHHTTVKCKHELS